MKLWRKQSEGGDDAALEMKNCEGKSKRIIITTTFRDFKGNANDRMQMLFLKSLARQTYRNYILAVTLFGEKNVEKTVRKILGEKVAFIETEIEKPYRYSLSKVILNGIGYGREHGADILLDCSGDIILQDNFLQTVADNYSECYAGISHPNIFYDVDDSFKVTNKRIGECCRGIDVRFFDFALLSRPDVYKILQCHTLYDWGGFEHFLTAIAMRYAQRMINVFRESKVIKFENDREASDESKQYFIKSHKRNSQALIRAAHKMKLDAERLFDLYYLQLQYHDPHYYASKIRILQGEYWRAIIYDFVRDKKWLRKWILKR